MDVTAKVALSSNATGSIFAVPESDWTTISKRVGMVYLTEGIEDEIARTIPEFPALVAACDTWRTATFPGLVAQAKALVDHCTTSITDFTALQHSIASLGPDEPLPAPVKASAGAAITTLHASTVTRSAAIATLATDVTGFHDANATADAQVDRYAQRLGPDWVSLAPSTTALDNATGLVLGAWQAINADLARLASGTIPITTQLLLSLDIASALLSWEHLQGEAKAFPSMAAGQARYLDGSWLSEPG